MGEAIARLREAALAIRLRSDQIYSEPRFEITEAAAKAFVARCRHLLQEFESGRIDAEEYASGLRRARSAAEQSPQEPRSGRKWYAMVDWLPTGMQQQAPPSISHLAADAATEALRWGEQFALVESRVRALTKETEAIRKTPQRLRHLLGRWLAAFDALAPFVGEPPGVATATAEKQPGRSRGRAGRPQKDEKLSRDLLDGWRAYETEDGRRLKRSYIAQRADVRVIKSREARERKIESLLLALNSAQHLKREKAKAAASRRN